VVTNWWGLVAEYCSVVCTIKYASCNAIAFLCLQEQAIAQLHFFPTLAMATGLGCFVFYHLVVGSNCERTIARMEAYINFFSTLFY
jgi:hypothetical protein